MRILPQAPRRTRPEGLDGGLQSPRRLDNQAQICCTFIAFARLRFVVDSFPSTRNARNTPHKPTLAPFLIQDEPAFPPTLPDEFVLPPKNS